MMEQLAANEGVVPAELSPEMYVEIQSLQLAVLLMAVCHVIVVVVDSMEMDTVLKYADCYYFYTSSEFRLIARYNPSLVMYII